MTLWDDVRTNLLTWYGTAAGKTNELAKVGSRRYDIFGLSRDIERQFTEMGSLVYNALLEGRTDIADDSTLLGLIARVQSLEIDLAVKKQEIDDIRAGERRKEEHKDAVAPAGAAPVAGSVDGDGPDPESEVILDESGEHTDDEVRDSGSGAEFVEAEILERDNGDKSA